MSKTDPTFDAIRKDSELSNETERAHAECEARNPGLGAEQMQGDYPGLDERQADARMQLVGMVPTTMDGVIARLGIYSCSRPWPERLTAERWSAHQSTCQ
jgi:hypothetical protein